MFSRDVKAPRFNQEHKLFLRLKQIINNGDGADSRLSGLNMCHTFPPLFSTGFTFSFQILEVNRPSYLAPMQETIKKKTVTLINNIKYS